MRSATRVRGHGHWPTRAEALLVDIDDHDRPLRCVAGLQHLEQVKDTNPKLLERQWIDDPQRGEGDKQN